MSNSEHETMHTFDVPGCPTCDAYPTGVDPEHDDAIYWPVETFDGCPMCALDIFHGHGHRRHAGTWDGGTVNQITREAAVAWAAEGDER